MTNYYLKQRVHYLVSTVSIVKYSEYLSIEESWV